ncbi:kinase [Solwaraspora sp. WMMD406]|uniref:kinase n=1 Tax=Solwaraspora sp. WMMD406 TaxID=3016095 RepID=UPI00241677E0|nr:kinase [Solwaraspora sp. WMMD406]MDG4768569.1 kinase [Solwaraspora sp. WMMD406]
MRQGVILYGPPAAGKDTITERLAAIDPAYQLFARLKTGRGRTSGYRMTTPDHLAALAAASGIIWQNQRYGATYVIDRDGLDQALTTGIPVLHMGQPDGIHAVTDATPSARWLVVYLWCPRDIAAQRIRERHTGDTSDRLTAWDQTPPVDADLTINTAASNPQEAAYTIHHATRALTDASAD